MKKHMISVQRPWIVALILAGACLAPAQDKITLLPVDGGDLFSDQLIPMPLSAKQADVERKAVSLSWALESGRALDLTAGPHVSESREYWTRVEAVDFRDGVALTTTQPGALVRISPLPGAGPALSPTINPMDLVLVNEAGKVFSRGTGMDLLVSAEEMEAAGRNPFSEGSSAFRIGQASGEGAFLLYGDNMDYNENSAYLIHIREQDSDWVLRLHTSQDSYFPNQFLRVHLELSSSKGPVKPDSVFGNVVSPSGRSFPLQFDASGEVGRLRLKQYENEGPGLWRVEVSAKVEAEGLEITRNGQTAFAYAVPTARLTGGVALRHDKSGVQATLDLDVASSGRYEVRGILFGSDSDGTLKPVALADAADWLEPGDATLPLSFDGELIEGSGLGAPFEIRDLRLIQQDRLALLHRQATALHFQ